ncbi:MAG: hypothetical protein M1832_004676 [Thelocarpon impressellum]|nr:MAG: hypothetical protein M1832_004676 [Thelocarpon impressellum]
MPLGMLSKAARPSTYFSKRPQATGAQLVAQAPPRAGGVDLVRPREPAITYAEIVRFLIWTIMVTIAQAWEDLKSFSFYRPVLSTHLSAHFFYLPCGRQDPRLVTSGPHTRMTVKMIPDHVTRQYETLDNIAEFPEQELVNCASNNYGGFSRLEHTAEELVEAGLLMLPFAPAPQHLQSMLRSECASYMGFDSCITTPSGFSTNVAAFATVAAVARAQGRDLVFLCDRDCHNSMFTGAYLNKGSQIHKFDHNDITDLDYKLRMYREQAPDALVCVAVEGIYRWVLKRRFWGRSRGPRSLFLTSSMEGSMCNAPAILALKRIHKFCLLIDEAHSFMAVGSAGRGSLNHWQDLGYDCSFPDVDIMTCMFSKSIGCTGGFAVANGIYAEALERQGDLLEETGVETLATPVILRVLSILRKPSLIRQRMRAVREKAVYVSKVLMDAGCKILSSPGSAIICFPVGTVRQVVTFSREAKKVGMAIGGGTPPATPKWGCRVRICIFATTTWPDIRRLLQTTITISLKLKISGVRRVGIDQALLDRQELEDEDVLVECRKVDAVLLDSVKALTRLSRPVQHLHGAEKPVIMAGVNALKKYGVGPCGARWLYGSYLVYVQLEQRLARLYPSLVSQSGRCRAMICGDAEVTIGSTLSACAVPPASGSVTNVVLVDRAAPYHVLRGAELPRANKRVIIQYYDSVDEIPRLLSELPKRSGFLVTLYLQAVRKERPLELIGLLDALATNSALLRRLFGLTLMLDDRHGLGKIGPRRLGFLDFMESKHGSDFLKISLARFPGQHTVLVVGSWFDSFGHQGGYVTGLADAVESLTWDAKAYFFSTPPMPLQAAMSLKTIELLDKGEAVGAAE